MEVGIKKKACGEIVHGSRSVDSRVLSLSGSTQCIRSDQGSTVLGELERHRQAAAFKMLSGLILPTLERETSECEIGLSGRSGYEESGRKGERKGGERQKAVGPSLGTRTTSMLLGASNTDLRNGATWYKPEPRIKVSIVLAGIRKGDADISEAGKTCIPFYGGDLSIMAMPALVIYGDEDMGPHLTIREATWHADPYMLAPGPKDPLW
ncbi:hypothetical protein B0H14DRAFT_2564285 [Mycena olivaceomarginata]|nr:hypothetical protein B0H14DRAFT_2564285 [Mycena olivaceomarginata]